jgi:hypothetical protein
MSGGSMWDSLECKCCFWIAGGLVPYLTRWLLTLLQFKNSIDTQGKLRLNLHSLIVSDLLEYRRKTLTLIVHFKSLFNTRFPSSLQTCQLPFQVRKLDVNFATKFIVQVEINNSMESSWSNGLPRSFVFQWIGYYYWVWTFVYKQSWNIEMYLRTLLRSSRPICEHGNVIAKFATNLGPARLKVTWNRQ